MNDPTKGNGVGTNQGTWWRSHDCRREGKHAKITIRIAVLSRIDWVEGPPALKKNEKDSRDVCPRIGTVN